MQPSRGLRQGDPIAPYLFILCSEFLTRLLLRKEEKGVLHGLKIDRNAPAVSHIMYADDLLIMGRSNVKEATIVNECFSRYCNWSGQEANLEKSSIYFSKNTRIQE